MLKTFPEFYEKVKTLVPELYIRPARIYFSIDADELVIDPHGEGGENLNTCVVTVHSNRPETTRHFCKAFDGWFRVGINGQSDQDNLDTVFNARRLSEGPIGVGTVAWLISNDHTRSGVVYTYSGTEWVLSPDLYFYDEVDAVAFMLWLTNNPSRKAK